MEKVSSVIYIHPKISRQFTFRNAHHFGRIANENDFASSLRVEVQEAVFSMQYPSEKVCPVQSGSAAASRDWLYETLAAMAPEATLQLVIDNREDPTGETPALDKGNTRSKFNFALLSKSPQLWDQARAVFEMGILLPWYAGGSEALQGLSIVGKPGFRASLEILRLAYDRDPEIRSAVVKLVKQMPLSGTKCFIETAIASKDFLNFYFYAHKEKSTAIVFEYHNN